MARIVLALGGNALGKTPSEQKKAVKQTAAAIVDLYQAKHEIVIVHGNGPQVGWINNTFMQSFTNKNSAEILPFPECGAMSQGYIGYHIQNAIQNELTRRKTDGLVTTLVSQTIVDNNDPAFKEPTKPIGDFMTEKDAKLLAKQNNWVVKEDAGRGWRRVIASPLPKAMPSMAILKTLLPQKVITIVGGGGGIPVVLQDQLKGVDAVIDKDATAAFIAKEIKADSLIILTAVNQIKINFGKANEKSIAEIDLKELTKHLSDKQFAPGSMLPKVLAAKSFVDFSKKPAYIGQLEDAKEIIEGKAGTKILF